mgnify:CR=1 FL=1
MKPVVRKILYVVGAIALVGAGLGAGLGYGFHKLDVEGKRHQTEIKDFEKKVALLQRRAQEERDRGVSAEGQKRALQGEVAKLQEENAAVAAELEGLKEKAPLLENGVKELMTTVTAQKAQYGNLEAKYSQLLQTAKNLEATLGKVSEEKKAREAELQATNEKLVVCGNHNAKLVAISSELLDRYEHKGLFARALQDEPLLQFKKVELEKLTQEYSDRIDKEKVK